MPSKASTEGPAAPRRRRAGARLAWALAVGLLLLSGLVTALALGWPAIWRLVDSQGSLARSSLERVWLALHTAELAPPGDDATPVPFVVSPGEDLAAVAERLAATGFVRDAETFRRFAQIRGLDRQVQAGFVQLRRNMRAEQVLQALLGAHEATVRVTLLEGWRAEEIAAQLSRAGIADEAEFLGLVRTGIPAGPIVSDRPPGAGLEGYLFPDTYDLAPGMGAAVALRRLLDTFEAKAGPVLSARSEAVELSSFEMVILASIVEREATIADERALIARVFLNRLAHPPYLLNADPTVQYALGRDAASGRWWKAALTPEDLAIDSVYNTYRAPGLPPTPIANPGLAAIEAVVSPQDGEWLYFVLDGERCDGHHRFAVTWEEHLANVERYRSSRCRQGPAATQ